MKSVTLTKAMRPAIVMGLVGLAIEKELKTLKVAYNAINASYWSECRQHWLDEAGMTEAQLVNLLSKRMIDTTRTAHPFIYADDVFHASSPVIEAFKPIVYCYYKKASIQFNSTQAEPSFHAKDAPKPNDRLVKLTDRLFARIVKLYQEAEKIHRDLTSVMQSFKTTKVLLEHFPQAKEFLPEPKTTSNIIPATLIKDVQRRLREGVPS